LAVAPMMMLSMALIALAAAHWLLPADGVESRATVEDEE
jgi:hypothetical protein